MKNIKKTQRKVCGQRWKGGQTDLKREREDMVFDYWVVFVFECDVEWSWAGKTNVI